MKGYILFSPTTYSALHGPSGLSSDTKKSVNFVTCFNLVPLKFLGVSKIKMHSLFCTFNNKVNLFIKKGI